MRLTETEFMLLKHEAARCTRCRSGERVECDGFLVVLDERASRFYGQAKMAYVACPHYRLLEHAGARESAVRRSGLPERWVTEPLPVLPSQLDARQCVIAPVQLHPKHSVAVSYLVQAKVMSHLRSGQRAFYILCATVGFEKASHTSEIMRCDELVALDRWDGGSHHERLTKQLCASLEARLLAGLPTVVGLLRPPGMLEPRVDEEVSVIGLLRSLPCAQV